MTTTNAAAAKMCSDVVAFHAGTSTTKTIPLFFIPLCQWKPNIWNGDNFVANRKKKERKRQNMCFFHTTIAKGVDKAFVVVHRRDRNKQQTQIKTKRCDFFRLFFSTLKLKKGKHFNGKQWHSFEMLFATKASNVAIFHLEIVKWLPSALLLLLSLNFIWFRPEMLSRFASQENRFLFPFERLNEISFRVNAIFHATTDAEIEDDFTLIFIVILRLLQNDAFICLFFVFANK